MKGACISRSALIVVMFLVFMCAKAQVLERLDLGVNAKNDFISPVVSYQLQENATLEFTLPYNFKLTPGTWVDEPGLHSFYGAIKYVNQCSIGTNTVDIYPLLIVLNSDEYNAFSDPLALGFGLGKSFSSNGWSLRPELELSFVREWFLPSAGAPIEHYYTSWPSIGITIKH